MDSKQDTYRRLGALINQRRFEEALAQADQTLGAAADDAQLWLMKGIALTFLDRAGEAETALNRCLELAPDNVAAHTQLGQLAARTGRTSQAETHYRAALELNPGLTSALNGLAVLFARAGKYAPAREMFSRMIEVNPEDPRPAINLANLHLDHGYGDRAGKLLAGLPPKAQEFPEFWATMRRLPRAEAAGDAEIMADEGMARALNRKGRHAEALDLVRRRITSLKGQKVPAGLWFEAARAYLGLEQTDSAQQALEETLKVDPEHRFAAHLLPALRGEAPATTQPELVASIFDELAPRFDQHLTQTLGYRIPEVLVEMLARTGTTEFGRVADLGCGTGLVGAALEGRHSHLAGVDLSAEMLQRAEERGLYDQLDRAEIAAWLHSAKDPFDTFFAADVFVYVGDLAPILHAARDAAAPGARLAFSVESGASDEGFEVDLTSGRYRHGRTYCAELAERAGWSVLLAEPQAIRRERSVPVDGYCFLLEAR